MPKLMRDLLNNGGSYDETDRIPDNISVTNLDILMYIVAIVGHIVDLGLDLNIAIRYYLMNRMVEFGFTLAFILIPAFVNTAVSIRMYAQDKQQDSLSNEFTKRRSLRILILVLQMAPILRFIDALIYAVKSRRAERKQDPASQRFYYRLMLKEDSDAALLRIFECFLEAAPQQVLQTTLLLDYYLRNELAVHQILSIVSSVASMGWCLAAYQRALRYTQQDKNNMDWVGSAMQTVSHFLITLSRIIVLAAMAHLYPHWTLLACIVHVLVFTTLLQIFDRSPFCSHNRLADIAFSLALSAVYIFTYILSAERRTSTRYTLYYLLCFLENICCAIIWYLFKGQFYSKEIYFHPVWVLCIVPFLLGVFILILYYAFFHPNVRKGVPEIVVTYQSERSD